MTRERRGGRGGRGGRGRRGGRGGGRGGRGGSLRGGPGKGRRGGAEGGGDKTWQRILARPYAALRLALSALARLFRRETQYQVHSRYRGRRLRLYHDMGYTGVGSSLLGRQLGKGWTCWPER
eukprot:1735274-Rhodomonas_salina.2